MTDADADHDTDTGTSPDTAEFDTEVQDGKTIAPTAQLDTWEDNPRGADWDEIERLADEIRDLGQYKPLIVSPDGTVLGGNMRLRALGGVDDVPADVDVLDEPHVWVSIVEADSREAKLEYALSDNDRVGYYEEDAMVDLVSDTDIDISQFKPDFYAPKDMSQYLAHAMDPDELLAGDATDGDDADDDSSSTPSDDTDESPSRQMERLGQEATTTMVQLYMTESQKSVFLDDHVGALKDAWGHDNTTDAVIEAVARAAESVAGPDVDTTTVDELLDSADDSDGEADVDADAEAEAEADD